MNVVVTTGPGHEPIDEVRRLTNFSTGELGLMLAGSLVRAGCNVVCLKGENATHAATPAGVDLRVFTTNDNLFAQLSDLATPATPAARVDAVFHVAALCDYKVARVEDAAGSTVAAAKIDSRAGRLTLVLEPARKVIADLRRLFPDATLVGWKYELNGGREQALARAWKQVRENHTDACVLNGRAWGPGFALCTPPETIQEFRGKAELAAFLPSWLQARATTACAAAPAR